MKFVLNLFGIAVILAICWLISWDRKNIKWKIVLKALIAEVIIAFLIVKIPAGQKVITVLSNGLTAVINCGNEGLSFVFGDLFKGELSIFIIQSLGNIIFCLCIGRCFVLFGSNRVYCNMDWQGGRKTDGNNRSRELCSCCQYCF